MNHALVKGQFALLLDEARTIFESTPALREFAAWPSDLIFREPQPRQLPLIDQLQSLAGLDSFHAALMAVARQAPWRQTYSLAEVGAAYLDAYGYVEIFGPTGVFHSQELQGFIGYWGNGLHYPRHSHEAAEIYAVRSGSARFEAEGDGAVELAAGDTLSIRPWQPHAITVLEHLLDLAFWKGAGVGERAWLYPRAGQSPR